MAADIKRRASTKYGHLWFVVYRGNPDEIHKKQSVPIPNPQLAQGFRNIATSRNGRHLQPGYCRFQSRCSQSCSIPQRGVHVYLCSWQPTNSYVAAAIGTTFGESLLSLMSYTSNPGKPRLVPLTPSRATRLTKIRVRGKIVGHALRARYG